MTDPPQGDPYEQTYGRPPYGPPGTPPAVQPGAHASPPDLPQPGGYGQPYGPAAYGPGSGSAPARRSRARLFWGLAIVGVLLVVAVVLSNLLGPRILDSAAVERDVAGQFEERNGVAIELSCEQEMRVVEGASYECTGTTEAGEDVTLQITVTDEDADRPAYTWTEP